MIWKLLKALAFGVGYLVAAVLVMVFSVWLTMALAGLV